MNKVQKNRKRNNSITLEKFSNKVNEDGEEHAADDVTNGLENGRLSERVDAGEIEESV